MDQKTDCPKIRSDFNFILGFQRDFKRELSLAVKDRSFSQIKHLQNVIDILVDRLFEQMGVYPVTVDYNLSFREMVKKGNYNWSGGLVKETYKIPKNGKTNIKIKLIPKIEKNVSVSDILKDFDKRDLRPVTLPELLAFGAKYPHKQEEFYIFALGSFFGDVNMYTPAIYRDAAMMGRIVNTLPVETYMLRDKVLFAVVRKERN